MAFRFIHTADVHLDSPLRSLSFKDERIADLIGNATRRAFTRIVDLCLTERVDALMIAGDLYDGDLRSMKTAALIRREMARLAEADIPVFVIRGNHDAASTVTPHLSLPKNVHVFGGRAGAIPVAGTGVVVHGISFAQPHISESLVPKYKPPIADAVNVGLLHTSLAGSPDHDVYAPCGVSDLIDHGFDYWGLGHIHKRAVYGENGPATIVMPGMPQGRHINEAGPKSVAIATIEDDRSCVLEERPTGFAEFGRVSADVSGLADWTSIIRALEASLGAASDAVEADHLVARLEIKGASSLGFRLRRDADFLLHDLRAGFAETGRCLIEAIDLRLEAPEDRSGVSSGDPFFELRALMAQDAARSPAVRKAARDLITTLQGQMPRELRDAFGDDDDALDALIEELIADGTEAVVARFAAERDRTDAS
ncbi:MAG: DNA repair exonuclease [Pseudomonadota bacterium]